VLDGLETPMRPQFHDHGGHPIRDVVADDAFVEHPGNAERPRTTTPRPIASMHRLSGWSRSFVLASLRALHLDQRLRPGASAIERALTPAARTGNDAEQRDHPLPVPPGCGDAMRPLSGPVCGRWHVGEIGLKSVHGLAGVEVRVG
jgi:hypothetical protein